MCGVIGAFIREMKLLSVVERSFIESRIRGMHATGLTYLKDGKLTTIIEKLPADKFIKNIDLSSMVDSDGFLKIIGHCRYSTSDLEYNQPLYHETRSIVHNGVITQIPYDLWSSSFDIECQTKNDSELLLRTLEESPLERWKDSSIAAISLSTIGTMQWMRNGKRPMSIFSNEKNIILASTRDILARSGVQSSGVVPFVMNTINETEHEMIPSQRGVDWQPR